MKMRKKSILRRLLPWLITLLILAALVIFVGIPLYADQETVDENPPKIAYYEGGNTKLTMENDSLLFELDPQNTHFTLTEKKTGRQWHSNPPDAASDPVAGSANKGVLQSTLIVTYSSESGVIDFNNFQYSIDNGSYWIDPCDDGSIDVTYAVGRIEKIYKLPTAITEERYKAFTGAMSKKDAKKVGSVYTLYKPEKVATLDNREELLALYPELENQPLYILKNDTSENNKKNIAGYFAAAGYTEEEYQTDMQLVAGAAENTSAVFNVTVNYRLEGGDFLVTVPYQKIRYRSQYPITGLTVLPMFGAAGTGEEGYMLIPEGGGALIRYNNGKLSQNSYYANLYGWDYGSERTEVVSETKNIFPVFGMTREGGSFICMLEGAASYGGIQADISMRYNSYNWICAKYTVLHSDKYNVSAKTARLVYMFEKQLPDDTVIQRYRFVDSDQYSDMAQAYGDYLRDRYPELKTAALAGDIPISVELVGAIDKTVVKLGMPVDSVVATTTFDDAGAIIENLADAGVKNLNVRFSGWANGGVSQKVLTGVKVVRELGGEGRMKQLIRKADSLNVPLYFDGIGVFAYRSGVLQGFIPFRDAARFTTREQIILYPYSPITYQPEKYKDAYYLVQPRFAEKMLKNLVRKVGDLNAYGVAFRDIGNILSGDYNPKDTTTREQVKQMNIDVVQQAKAAGEHVIIKEGYDYVMPYADLITDMDLNGIDYSIIDESIPFYQMAIHGSVSYTGEPLNLANNLRTELLRCAEYGAGLNFTFMNEDTKVLQDTYYSGYFGANYKAWKQEATEMILAYQKAMKGLNGVRMLRHEVLVDGVKAVTYENGTKVYVNYTNADYMADGIVIPAGSYQVTGGNPQ